jgi:hypothetical protein
VYTQVNKGSGGHVHEMAAVPRFNNLLSRDKPRRILVILVTVIAVDAVVVVHRVSGIHAELNSSSSSRSRPVAG